MRQDIDKKSASFITDESLSLDNVKSDLSVIKVTPEKYQWYINNYT